MIKGLMVRPPGFDFYVSTTGGTGAGTIGDPWSVAYAGGTGAGTATGDGKLPTTGARLAVRGGTYELQTFSFAAGGVIGSGLDAPDGKLHWMAYPGENVQLQGVSSSTANDDIQINGNFQWFWDIEFSRKWRERLVSHTGGSAVYFNLTTDGTKCLYCIFHDGDDCLFFEPGVGRVEIYAPIVYNAGNDQNPRGHNFYIQHNDATGTKDLIAAEVVCFNTFGFLVQMFAGSGANRQEGVKFRWFFGFNPGVHNTTPHWSAFTLDNPVDDIRRCEFNDQVVYLVDANAEDVFLVGNAGNNIESLDILRCYIMGSGGDAGTAGVHLRGEVESPAGSFKFKNGFIDVAETGNRRAIRLDPLTANLGGADIDNNEYIRDPTTTSWRDGTGLNKTFANYQTDTGKEASSTASATHPTVTQTWVRPTTKYRAGQGFVAYRNWAGTSRIAFDLSTILSVGETFEVHDVRDPKGSPITVFDAASGGNPVTVYTGALVYFPTTQATDPALSVNPDVNIASSTNATPIEITTASAHGYLTGDTVRVADHLVNTNANGTRVITFVDSTRFTLNGSTGNGVGGATGIVSGKPASTPPATTPNFNVFRVRRI